MRIIGQIYKILKYEQWAHLRGFAGEHIAGKLLCQLWGNPTVSAATIPAHNGPTLADRINIDTGQMGLCE
jgi:hypothetical protein